MQCYIQLVINIVSAILLFEEDKIVSFLKKLGYLSLSPLYISFIILQDISLGIITYKPLLFRYAQGLFII